ncbi:MAG TPA: maltose ABC transporter substrate-binding protein, partial [Candidatus Limnocylindrales bacterium]|nr:maltose ABC transporter substrate-binding protein [Candidatus Limnocylindrales bacterium]
APTEAPTESPGEPTPDPTPSPPPGATEGTLVIWADEVRAPFFTQIGQDFAAAVGGIEVQVYQLGFGDIRDNLVLRGPAGEGPDIIIGAHDWLGQLATAGVVEPLDLGDKAASVDPTALQAFTYDGTLYGLPIATEAIALYYNTDLVPEPPATWDEMLATAQALQDAGTVEQGYCLQQGDPYHSYPILSGNGGYIFGRDPATDAYDPSDVGLDSDGGIAYANQLSQMVQDGILRADIGYGDCLYMMTGVRPDWIDPETPQRGGSAFWITGPWALPDFNSSGINYGVAPIPTINGNTPAPFIGVQGMMVSANAPNKLLAQTFLTEYMATDEAMQAVYEADPRPPAWTPTANAVTDENVQAFIASASNGHPMPAIPEMSSVWDAWTQAINQIFAQQGDAEQNIRNAADAIRASITGP